MVSVSLTGRVQYQSGALYLGEGTAWIVRGGCLTHFQSIILKPVLLAGYAGCSLIN